MSEFDALVVSQEPDGPFTREIVRKDTADLPAGDLLVRVAYSSLNFKDALAVSGRRGVARGYPLTPGIDAAGTVAESSVAEWSSGDRVIIGGHELGTGIPGGFGRYIRVPAAAALRLPAGRLSASPWSSERLASRPRFPFGPSGRTASCPNAGRSLSRGPPAALDAWRWRCFQSSATRCLPGRARSTSMISFSPSALGE